MRQVVYDVAVSIDNFISHADGSVEGLLQQGEHVADYFARLQGYDTVLMGRATYEWGYGHGLTPGQRAYPHMEHHVFSKRLRFDAAAAVQVVDREEGEHVEQLKQRAGSDIYLCGGGAFAGFLLDRGLIDRLVLKVSPIVFGHGVRLFGPSARKVELALTESKAYGNGVMLLRYDVNYRTL